MNWKQRIIFLILFIGLTYSIFATSPYKYTLSIYVWREIEFDLDVHFKLNAPKSRYWAMQYGEGEDGFLDLFFMHKSENMESYKSSFHISVEQKVDGFFKVRHASKDFLKLDAILQLQYLFKEIIFEVQDKRYSLDLNNLDKSALRLNFREIVQSHTLIQFNITEEFLSKFCILQDEKPSEKSE